MTYYGQAPTRHIENYSGKNGRFANNGPGSIDVEGERRMAKFKLSDFLVKKRIIFMLVAVAIAIASIFMIPLTNINSDMTRYLPDDSQMKQGIDKMSEEFGDNGLGSGMVRVMFKSLPDSTRNSIKDELSDIDGVANVIYIEGSDEYNHEEKALYELLGNSKRSQHELADDIRTRYGDEVIVETSEQDTTAPVGVMLIALALLLAVLLIMCESWLEPPIFLIAIGVAVAINMGTNALLESVSATTNSIAAILQLVLSIDYSIILMNRYRQEKASGKTDKVEAMSAALGKASSSIVSSAFTTIVGLLALVFMKLKIGADMGIVLAKGVLCSLIAIFTVLPTLIILLDGAIEKSKKRVLKFHTERLAGFSMKFRIPLAILFVAIFAGSYWLHKKTEISFSIEQKSQIAETFPQKNITALLYSNSDSLKIIELADSISKNQHVKSFVSYPSLMQKKYTALETKELLDEMTSMTGDLDMDDISSDQIVKTIYYIKSGELANEKISLHDFAILLSDFATDTTYTTDLDIPISSPDSTMDIEQSLKLLTTLTDTSFISKKLTCDEISETIGIDKELVSILCPRGTKMTIKEAISTAKILASSAMQPIRHHRKESPKETTTEIIADSTNNDTTDIQDFAETTHTNNDDNIYTDSSKVHSQYTPAEIAEIIGMKEKQASTIYSLYGRTTGKKTQTMSLYEFIYFINHDLSKRKLLASQFDAESREWLSNAESMMATTLTASNQDTPATPTIVHPEVDTAKNITEHTEKKHEHSVAVPMPKVDKEMLAMLDKAENLITIASEAEKFGVLEMHDILDSFDTDIDTSLLELAYLYYGTSNFDNDSLLMSAEEILDIVTDSIIANKKFAPMINENIQSSIQEANDMVDSNLGKLRGKNFSQAIIFSDYPKESSETNDFVESLTAQCNTKLNGDHYLIGESVMMNEMRNQWGSEMLLVTLITILSIFLIVAITFRSLAVPFILVMTVMSAVYINVFVSGHIGQLLYLAYLIMQSILMGATIDYGILFTNNYREARTSLSIKNAIWEAYKSSTHTIVTSGTIMTIAPLAMSFMMDDPTTIMILQCIAIGAFAAVMLIIFVLPGLLGAFDRFIAKKGKTK